MPRFSAVPISMRTKSSEFARAPLAVLITRIEPARTDDSQQCVTFSHLLAKNPDEVGTQRNGVHVHEQKIAAELPLQSVVYPAGVACTVVASVTDEQSRGHSLPSSKSKRDAIRCPRQKSVMPITKVAFQSISPSQTQKKKGRYVR